MTLLTIENSRILENHIYDLLATSFCVNMPALTLVETTNLQHKAVKIFMLDGWKGTHWHATILTRHKKYTPQQ